MAFDAAAEDRRSDPGFVPRWVDDHVWARGRDPGGCREPPAGVAARRDHCVAGRSSTAPRAHRDQGARSC